MWGPGLPAWAQPHPAASPAKAATSPAMNSSQTSIYNDMAQFLTQWGLTSLLGDLKGLVMKGYQGSELTLHLRETNAYKTRFAGNAERIKNGLPALSEADYLSTEASYQQVLRSYGIPAGFYDSHADFVDFIGKGVSPTELSDRAKIAHDQYLAAPDDLKQLWSQYFGVGDAIAAILDPKVATSVIQDRATQVGIGGAAAAQGLHVDQARAQQFQQAGVTQDQAKTAYQQIAASMPTDQQIAQRFGTTFGQTDEENDALLGEADAARKRQVLYGEEKGLFSSQAGASATSLGVSQSY